MKKRFFFALLVALFLGVIADTAPAATVAGSPHDLSKSNEPPCIYCHAPTTSKDGTYPQWDPSAKDTKGYEIYGSDKKEPPPPEPWWLLPSR